MNQKFDILGRYKYPNLKLCKPDRSGQCYIGAFNNLKIKLVFNSLSEMSFEVPYMLDGKENPVYNRILGGKVIYADDFGYFIIQDTSISGDGIFEKKNVSAISAEVELTRNKLNRVEDTLRLYDPMNPKDESTILGFFLKQNKRWALGTVDSELWEKYRNFDVQTTDWYSFLVNDVEKKFMCIFQFDNVKRVLHCRTTENSTKKTNIFATYDNLIDKIKIDEKYNETFTAFNCYGADDLDVRSVNPIGGNIIYNFDYFKTTEWIPQTLIDHINEWERKIKKEQPTYKNLLTELRERQAVLTTKQSDLVELETKLKSTEQALGMVVTQKDNNRYNQLVTEKNSIQTQINGKRSEIRTAEANVDATIRKTSVINRALSFENNFTQEELYQINDITYLQNYQNDGFKKTSIMTPAEIQDESQSLYDYSIEVLKIASQPRYYFKSDLVNFIFLKEYEKFTKQIDVGSIITVEIKKGWRTPVVVLSIELDFDNPTNFSMEFSNRHRLDNGSFQFDDLYSGLSYGQSSYDWDKAIIAEPVKSGMMQNVNNFMKSNFEASKNALVSAKGIGVTIDGSGLHLRRSDDTGNLMPHEIWMTGDQIAFSDDNFNTFPKIAIGRFKMPNSENEAYGINAEFLAGRLIVGNQFLMEAENGSFKFDGTGASLFNANFEVIDRSSLRRTLIDPNVGFKIQGRQNTNLQWEDKIWLDNEGNAIFKGKIESTAGKIAGWRIEAEGLYSPYGDYLKSDGTGKLSLMTWTPYSATFDGNIYARNLRAGYSEGWVNDSHFADNSLDGDKISNNSISEAKLEAVYRDKVTESIARVEVKADKNSASISSLASYTNSEFGKVSSSIARVDQKVADNMAEIELVAKTSSNNKSNIASLKITVNNNSSKISAQAKEISLKADKTTVDGLVTFKNGLSNGTTTISGGCISTGTLSASKINMNGRGATWTTKNVCYDFKNTPVQVVSSVDFKNKKVTLTTVHKITSASFGQLYFLGTAQR